MARKKAEKKVEEIEEEVIDEEAIDLEDYEDEDFDLEDDDDEFEIEEEEKVEEPEVELTLEERVANMEKKLNVVMVLTIVIALVAVATMFIVIFKDGGKEKKTEAETNTQENSNNEEGQEELPEYDVSKFKEITANDVASVSKGKTILLYIGRSTCGYCRYFVPVLNEIQEKYGTYTTYYLDIAKIYDYSNGVVIDEKAEKTMINLKTSDSQKGIMSDFGATPMTLFIKDGKIIDGIVGYVESSVLDNAVISNGLNK